MTANDETPELVMPFVCTTSTGGPFDAEAFVAGCQMQQISDDLEHASGHFTAYSLYVDPRLAEQLDLVAMRFGWSVSFEPWDEHPDDWALATFVRGEHDR